MDRLPLVFRARARVERRALRWLFATPGVVSWLGRGRREPVEGRDLDPHLAALLALDDMVGASSLVGRSPRVARRLMAQQIPIVEETPPANVLAKDVTFPTPAGRERARVYVPPGATSPSPAVVYIHGGGFVTGSIETHDGVCRRIATQARVRVISLSYRLAPEHPFPAAVEDGLAGVRWVLASAKELEIDQERVAVAGDSAGGTLSAVVSHNTRRDPVRPKLVVLLYPDTDATCSLGSHVTMGKRFFLTSDNIDWYFDHYAGDTNRKHPDLSPLFSTDFSNLPRTLIYTAGFDPLRDEGRAYANALERAGSSVEYEELPSMVHGFVVMGGAVPAARLANERIFTSIGEELRS